MHTHAVCVNLAGFMVQGGQGGQGERGAGWAGFCFWALPPTAVGARAGNVRKVACARVACERWLCVVCVQTGNHGAGLLDFLTF